MLVSCKQASCLIASYLAHLLFHFLPRWALPHVHLGISCPMMTVGPTLALTHRKPEPCRMFLQNIQVLKSQLHKKRMIIAPYGIRL